MAGVLIRKTQKVVDPFTICLVVKFNAQLFRCIPLNLTHLSLERSVCWAIIMSFKILFFNYLG